MKKIALAVENFSPFAGGAESYAVSLAAFLSDSGWEVHLFGERWEGYPPNAVFHRMKVPSFLPAFMKILVFALKCRKRMLRDHYDVVLGFGNTIHMNVYQSHGGVHNISTKKKIYAEPNAIVRFFKRITLFFSAKHYTRHWIESAPFQMQPAPIIVAISDMIKNDIKSFYKLPENNIQVVYNGVDVNRYNPTAGYSHRDKTRDWLGVKDNETVFLFLSYDLKKKGIIPLISAALILKQKGCRFRIVVAGGSPNMALKKRIKKFGLHNLFLFLGKTRNPLALYGGSDVFVLPTYYDACSLVVFEAMACGLPVITTNANGAAGIINNGEDGMVLQHPPEAVELADKMEHLMIAPVRLQMGEKAVQKVKVYTIEKNHRAMAQIFERLVK
ncbi:MAG: glycosyltransferase family 4 protein [Thermodesulfobacteriota bacterium]|nr:glycosyltransferase family 4 protein [Thermodesulfobacteriota bacterium]